MKYLIDYDYNLTYKLLIWLNNRRNTNMKLDFDQTGSTPTISHYSENGIIIGSETINVPFIACAEELLIDELPQTVAELTEAHIHSIIGRNVDIIILGTGATQIFPNAAILLPALTHGVGVEVMETGAACRSYNVLVGESRSVAGIFFPLS